MLCLRWHFSSPPGEDSSQLQNLGKKIWIRIEDEKFPLRASDWIGLHSLAALRLCLLLSTEAAEDGLGSSLGPV